MQILPFTFHYRIIAIHIRVVHIHKQNIGTTGTAPRHTRHLIGITQA